MKYIEEELGIVSVHCEGNWDSSKEYTRLSIVNNDENTYIAKTKVPKDIDIINEDYWQQVYINKDKIINFKTYILNNLTSLNSESTVDNIINVFGSNKVSIVLDKIYNSFVLDYNNKNYLYVNVSISGSILFLSIIDKYSFKSYVIRADKNNVNYESVISNEISINNINKIYYSNLNLDNIILNEKMSEIDISELNNIENAIRNNKTILSSKGIINFNITYRHPSDIVNISYVNGNVLKSIKGILNKLNGGTWTYVDEFEINDTIKDVESDNINYCRKNRSWIPAVGVLDKSKKSEIFNDYDNNIAIGEYSHIEGQSSEKAYSNTTIPTDVQQIMMDWYMSSTGWGMAYGIGCHVEGQNCLATGNYSHVEGIKNLAANDGAHAEGSNTNAAGVYAHAEGLNTTAYAQACHAEGGMSVCNGNYGHVEGFRCTVENTAGHAEGYITYCRANYGHVEGRQTNSIGPCAHAEGYGNKIDRSITITNISNIEGDSSSFTADNISDLKIGACFIIDYIPYVVTNIADGNVYVNRWIEFKQQKYDIIIMYGAAYGNNSHAEGELGSAIGNNSHVSGASCIAFNDNEVACGHYNYSFWSDDNAKRTLYSIGIGESDSNRKNAYELKENGDLYIYGVGGYTGKNSSEAKTIQKVIAEQQQGGSGGGIPDAPTDGKTYGRKDGEWTTTEEVIDLGELDFDPNDTSTFSVFDPYLEKVGVYKFMRIGYFSQCRLDVFISGTYYGTPILSAILTIDTADSIGSGNYHSSYWNRMTFIRGYEDGEWRLKPYIIYEMLLSINQSNFLENLDSMKTPGIYKIYDHSGKISAILNVTNHYPYENTYITQSLHAYVNDDISSYVLDGFRTLQGEVWSEWKTAKTTLE